MSMQLSFLGGVSTSFISAVAVSVNASTIGEGASASVSFRTDGRQSTSENGSETVIGNWVSPSFSANDWEVRATLVNGATPTVGTLDTWQDISVTRTWTVEVLIGDNALSTLTFDFRRKGDTDPETTISGNIFTVEHEDLLSP